MNNKIIALFILIFLLYIPFSRNPDYFDGKLVIAVVHKNTNTTKALFNINNKDTFSYNPSYLFNSFKTGEKIKTIYATNNPHNAAHYSIWGYWLTWKELLILPIAYIILFQIAKAIVANPSEDAIKELEEESKKPKIRKPRYDV